MMHLDKVSWMKTQLPSFIREEAENNPKRRVKGFVHLISNEDGSFLCLIKPFRHYYYDWTKEEAEDIVHTVENEVAAWKPKSAFFVADHTEKLRMGTGIWKKHKISGVGEFGYQLYVDVEL